jgi:hypothetical protein
MLRGKKVYCATSFLDAFHQEVWPSPPGTFQGEMGHIPWMLPQNRHLVPWMLGPQRRHRAAPFKEGKIKEVSNAQNIACQVCT